MKRTIGVAVAVATAFAAPAVAAPAHAATPVSGTITEYEPVTKWTGVAAGGVPNLVHFFYDDTLLPCEEILGCDAFTLTTEHRGRLSVTVGQAEKGYTEVLLRKPDGTYLWSSGDADSDTTHTISNAPAGTYTLEVLTDDLQGVESGEYSGVAKLNNGIAKPRPETSASKRTRAGKKRSR